MPVSIADDFCCSVRRIGQQGQLVAIEYRVRIITYPVTQVDIPAAGNPQGIIDGQVTMTKNKIIEMFLLEDFFAIDDQPFFFLTQEQFVDLTGNGPAAA